MSGLTFRSISANGAVNGIVLNNTGTGGLTVTGDGGGAYNASGGMIQNTTGVGVSLASTQNVSLNYMTITGSGDDGIERDLFGHRFYYEPLQCDQQRQCPQRGRR